MTAAKFVSRRTSYGPRWTTLRRLRPTWISLGRTTARSGGANHKSGMPSPGHGKIPVEYAKRSRSSWRSPPIARRPSAEAQPSGGKRSSSVSQIGSRSRAKRTKWCRVCAGLAMCRMCAGRVCRGGLGTKTILRGGSLWRSCGSWCWRLPTRPTLCQTAPDRLFSTLCSSCAGRFPMPGSDGRSRPRTC